MQVLTILVMSDSGDDPLFVPQHLSSYFNVNSLVVSFFQCSMHSLKSQILLSNSSLNHIRLCVFKYRPDRSYHVCGPTMGKSSSSADVYNYELRSLNGVRIVQVGF